MTTYTPSKKIKQYLSRIEEMRTKEGIKKGEIAGTFSMRDIRGMKRLLNNYGRIKEVERQALFDALILAIDQNYFETENLNWHHTFSLFGIDEEQTRKGLEWFRKNLKRWEREAKGKYRLNSQFTAFVSGVRDAITHEQFKEFRFGGFQKNAPDTNISYKYGVFNVIPIWQVVMNDGTAFAYSYGSWQSNTDIEYGPDFNIKE